MSSKHTEKLQKCDITVDGERFDITNLLAELPLPKEVTATATATATATGSSQTPRRTSKLAKMEKQSSHYFPRGFSLYEGIQDEEDDDDMSFAWGDFHPLRRRSTKKSRRSSSLSSITMSYCMPGLADLAESQSSFTGEDDECQEIQVGPGVYLPFRGRDETWKAIQEGRAVSIQCLECTIELVVARDCKHAICPECHTLNPISMKDYSLAEDGDPDATRGMRVLSSRDSIHFGVLMGFKVEWCGDYYDQVQQLKKK
jgi:hypothetical protein